MINVLIISIDQNIKSVVEKNYNSEYHFITFNSTNDSLDIMAQISMVNPAILIMDDDFINHNTIHLLSSIKKANPKLPIIFITSNTSIETGRSVNIIGVTYYLIKPISNENLFEFIKSVEVQSGKYNY